MPLYFHIQRAGVARFKVGKSYSFGQEQNFFARDLFAVDFRVPVAGVGEMPLNAILKDYFDSTGMHYFRKIRSQRLTPDEKGLLGGALTVLDHQAKLVREYVIEEVRRESFPDKPSRLRGIWLIPHNPEVLDRWAATAPKNQFQAFEVEVEGRFHHGASKYLRSDCIGVEAVRENARRYWSEPADPLGESAEILADGEVKVLREVKVAGSTQSSWTILKGKLGFH
jgi:hypothetical protein